MNAVSYSYITRKNCAGYCLKYELRDNESTAQMELRAMSNIFKQPKNYLSVGTLKQVLDADIQAAIINSVSGTQLFSVRGTLGSVDYVKNRYATLYGIRLNGDGAFVLLDIPRAVAQNLKLQGGEDVIATGMLKAKTNASGFISCNVDVSCIDIVGRDASVKEVSASKATIASIKSVGLKRFQFPLVSIGQKLKISLICSGSGQALVESDFAHELSGHGESLVEIDKLPVNIISADSLVQAIDRANGDIVAIIRGGGDEAQFDVFDDERVVRAFAAKMAYRVVGLGHSANSTMLDLVADFSANTPTHAGVHIRDAIEYQLRRSDELSSINASLVRQVALANQSIAELRANAIVSASKLPGVNRLGIAFACGLIVAILLVRLF